MNRKYMLEYAELEIPYTFDKMCEYRKDLEGNFISQLSRKYSYL